MTGEVLFWDLAEALYARFRGEPFHHDGSALRRYRAALADPSRLAGLDTAVDPLRRGSPAGARSGSNRSARCTVGCSPP